MTAAIGVDHADDRVVVTLDRPDVRNAIDQDMIDALHPQTILAHTMNGQPLPVGHGAPIRLRVERALGYKQAKYVMKIKAVDTLAGIYGGGGGYWEDHSGYQWFAGI